MSRSTAGLGPESGQLGEDAVTELVAGPRESERGMGVQALEAPGACRAADAGVQLGPEAALLRVRVVEAPSTASPSAARVQRSTPPPASSREIAATRNGQVT
jgi:hypothetical protein